MARRVRGFFPLGYFTKSAGDIISIAAALHSRPARDPGRLVVQLRASRPGSQAAPREAGHAETGDIGSVRSTYTRVVCMSARRRRSSTC